MNAKWFYTGTDDQQLSHEERTKLINTAHENT